MPVNFIDNLWLVELTSGHAPGGEDATRGLDGRAGYEVAGIAMEGADLARD